MFGWPWFRRRPDPPSPPTEGERARVRAAEALRQERARMPETKRLADSLRNAGTRNHFGESMIELFRGVTK